MGRSADAFLVTWCPDDEEYGEPLFIADQHPAFGVIDFTLSLKNGEWPLGMTVKHEDQEWTVVSGADRRGKASQVIESNNVVKGPVASGLYLEEYTWMYTEATRKQAKLRRTGPNGKAAITEEEAVEIHDRYLYSADTPTQADLAREYEIGQKQVSNIVREVAWAYLWE